MAVQVRRSSATPASMPGVISNNHQLCMGTLCSSHHLNAADGAVAREADDDDDLGPFNAILGRF